MSSGSHRCRGRAQRRGSEAGSQVRPAWSGSAPTGGKEAEWPGEAKIADQAVLAGPVGGGSAGDLFLADISEVVTTRLNPEATLLVIESWTPQRGGYAWWNANEEGIYAGILPRALT